MIKRKVDWNFEKDESLIDLVKSNPALYDTKFDRYSDTEAKRQAWIQIGHHLATPASACKIRWESLRCQYRRNIKKRKMNAPGTTPRFRFDKQMFFLQDHLKDINNENATQSDEDEVNDVVKQEFEMVDIEEHTLEEKEEVFRSEDPDPERKIEYYEDNASENSQTALIKYLIDKKGCCDKSKPAHPIDMFFSLMAATVKNFKTADQHLVKTKVFELVNGIETKYVEESASAFGYQLSSPTVMGFPSTSPFLSSNSTGSFN